MSMYVNPLFGTTGKIFGRSGRSSGMTPHVEKKTQWKIFDDKIILVWQIYLFVNNEVELSSF